MDTGYCRDNLEKMQSRIEEVAAGLIRNPMNQELQQELNNLSRGIEDCEAVLEPTGFLTPKRVCENLSAWDAKHFFSNRTTLDDTRRCQQATRDCPFSSIRASNLSKNSIDFRKTFAEVLPYPSNFRYKSFTEIAESFLNIEIRTQYGQRVYSLAKMLKRMETAYPTQIRDHHNRNKMYNVAFSFDDKVEILRVLLGTYYQYVNFDMLKVFEKCGQMVESIVLNDGTQVFWTDKLRPETQVQISFFSQGVKGDAHYPSKIKPRAAQIIAEIKKNRNFFRQPFSQQEISEL